MYEDIKSWGSIIQESIDKEAEYKKQLEAYEAEKAVMDSAEDIELDEAEQIIDWQAERAYRGLTPTEGIKKELEIVGKAFPKVKLELNDMSNINGGISTVKVSGNPFDVDKFLDAYEIGFSDDILNAWDKIDDNLKTSIQSSDDMVVQEQMTVSLENPGGTTLITLDGDADTNAEVIDMIYDVLRKHPSKNLISFYQVIEELCKETEKEDKKETELKEWNDTHIPQGRVGHHETGIPKKYWVAIGDDQLINNYSEFVNQSLQLKPLANNASPSFTTQDIQKIKELAKRAIVKFPGKFVFVGVDDTSRGMMTGKNHLRASVRYIYDPKLGFWNDNDMYNETEDKEDSKLEESYINEIRTLKQLKKAISNYGSAEQDMKVILADTTGKKYQITEVNVIPIKNEDIIGIDIDEVNVRDILF